MQIFKSHLKDNWIVILMMMVISSAHGQPLSMPEEVTYQKLENGFTYYLVPKEEPGVVGVYVISQTGHYVERMDQRGYAHALEHMMYKGTKNYPGTGVPDAFEKMGMRFGGEFNAVTNQKYTEYEQMIPENNLEYLEKCLLVLKDMMFELQIDSLSLEIEKEVILEELNLKNGKGAVSPYFVGTVLDDKDGLGTIEEINSVNADSLRAFYQKHYGVDQLALVIVGNVNKAQAHKQIQKIFGGIAPAKAFQGDKYPDVSATKVNPTYESRVLKGTGPLLVIDFKVKHDLVIDNYAAFKQHFIEDLFTDIMAHRLKNGQLSEFYKVDVHPSVISPGFMHYIFRLTGKAESDYSAMLSAFCQIWSQTQASGIYQEEIDFYAQDKIKRYATSGKNSVSKEAVREHFLTGEVPIGDSDRAELLSQVLKELKPEDFSDLLNDISTHDRVVLYDENLVSDSLQFNEESILKQLDAISALRVAPYEYVPPKAKFSRPKKEVDTTVTVNIAARNPAKIKHRKDLGDQVYSLDFKNGLTVLVNRNTNVPAQISIMSKNGLNMVPEEDRRLLEMTYEDLDAAIGDYSAQETKELLKALGSHKKEHLGDFGYSMKLTAEDWSISEVLKAFNLYLTAANAVELEEFLPGWQRQLNRGFDEEQAYARYMDEVMGRTLKKGVAFDSSVDQNTLNKLFDYYQSIKLNFENSVVFVGGDLPENIDELIATYIGSIEPKKFDFIAESDASVLPEEVVHAVVPWSRTTCIEEHLFVQESSKGQFTFKEELLNEAVAQYGKMRITEIMRRKYGLVYSMGGSSSTQNYPTDRQCASIRFVIEPEFIEQSKDIMREEVVLPMSRGEISADDIEKVKGMLGTLYLMYFYSPGTMSGRYLGQKLKYGKYLSIDEMKAEIDNVSADDLKEFMKRIVDIDSYYVLVRMPEHIN